MKLEIAAAADPEAGCTYPAPWTASSGTKVAVPIDGPLRLVVAWLGAGDRIDWPETHGEEAVYVLDGEVEVDGSTVPAGGALVLHADEPCSLVAPDSAHLAHFSSRSGRLARHSNHNRPELEVGGAGKHLLGPGGWYRSGSPGGSQATWFADSTCDGCDVALFRVERDTPGNRGRAHSHSADEILFLVEGGIRLGAHDVPTGTAVSIPAGTRYAITCGATAHAFLNYRPTASIQHYEGDDERLPENGLGRGGQLVGDFLT